MKVAPIRYSCAEEPFDYHYLSSAVCAILPKAKPGVSRLLDIGCGNGFWTKRFTELGYTAVGIDPSPTGIEQARKVNHGPRYEVMEVSTNLCEQLGEEPFDFVVSLEVVEHVYSARQWAAGCYAALKAGGGLVCSTPYHGYGKNLAISLMNHWDRHWSPNDDGGHIKFWSKNTLAELLCRAGFQRETVAFRGAGRLPFLWKSMVLRICK